MRTPEATQELGETPVTRGPFFVLRPRRLNRVFGGAVRAVRTTLFHPGPTWTRLA